MCGIAGYVQRASSPARPIDAMTARLAHRGPDGSGIWESRVDDDWVVALGHRRLAILDPAHGRQPLATDDGSTHITYNGEVYNFAELRTPLERAGVPFHTHCDTEVVLHHLRHAREGGLIELHGMFALGLWDENAGGLLLARDRIGIKPLYYAPLPDGGIAFASELTALLEHPAVERALDPQALLSLFFLDYVQPPQTIVRGACKLEPGHFLTWTTASGPSPPAPYWKLKPGPPRDDRRSVLREELRERLREAVRSQLVSDVPLGVFLSGGIDSSLVAALAAQQCDEPIKTFSIAFEDPSFDESHHSRAVAAHIGSDHAEQTLSEATLLDTLDRALDSLDEPIGDPSIVPTYLLSQLAAAKVKVALGGDGADELWAGYPTYVAHGFGALYRRLPRLVRQRAIEPLVRLLPVGHRYQSLDWKLNRFVLRWDDQPLLRHLRWMSNTDLPDLHRCLTEIDPWPEGLARLTCGDGDPHDITLDRILATDLASYLPGAVLTKVDRASMAHGLEVRPPMLDERLVDFAFSLPPRLKLRGRTSKVLLKQVAEEFLPRSVVYRRKKGFAIPLAAWLNGPLRARIRTVIEESPIWETGLLCRATFRTWLDEHRSRHCDRSKPLWTLLVLSHWWQRVRPAPSRFPENPERTPISIPPVLIPGTK